MGSAASPFRLVLAAPSVTPQSHAERAGANIPCPKLKAVRYSAYLLATWHAATRPVSLELNRDGKTKWLGLDIRHHARSGASSATVEFVARYKIGGRASRMHETSRFVREGDRWYYVDGELRESATDA